MKVSTSTLEQKAKVKLLARAPCDGDNDPSWGKPDATVTIVEFGDFLCPYCKRGRACGCSRKSMARTSRVVFKNLPLRMHHTTRRREAAGRQRFR